MKKVLLAFDGSNYSEGAFEFARILNERSKILITGIFVPKTDYASLWSYAGQGASNTVFVPYIEDVDSEEVKKTISKFEKACQQNDIQYKIHKDYDSSALSALMKESRFADLMILGSETFYSDYSGKDVSEYLKETLHEVECPTIVVPENFIFPKTNIIAYDGSKSSVFAIKQFIYLFPELLNNKSLLVYNKDNDDKDVPDQILIEELAVKHFPNLTIQKNNTEPDSYFNTFLLGRKGALLISGSFGRGGVGSLFHKSFVSDIIKEHGIPVFITHRN